MRNTSSLLALIVATAGAPFSAAAQPMPSSGIVTHGEATISSQGATLIVNQNSRHAIINWGGFSVGSGATAHFENGAGATLNRVTGNLPSAIDGVLSATGSVYLVNPAGIAVGNTGRITTGGSFIAATLDITDRDFLEGGPLLLKGQSGAGIVNAGVIVALSGDVVLSARRVENTGAIHAPQGDVGLLAGHEVLLHDTADTTGRFAVKLGGAGTEVVNSGTIEAVNVELRANGGNVMALAGNTESIVKATGVRHSGGRILLTAGEGGDVQVSQNMVARRAADAQTRAEVAALPATGPRPKARPDYAGGEISVSGGAVTLSGQLDAAGAGAQGGEITVTGATVTLASGALLEASGSTGGTILIGGDYQGGADAAGNFLSRPLERAQTTLVAAGAVIRADGAQGDGGRVVVWADDHTAFHGAISATGAGTGAGGFAEVSGKRRLDFTGRADLRAESGGFGTLLLDPYNITISAGGDSNHTGFTANGDDSVINVTTLTNALATANVTVSTGVGGSQAGDITVAAPISWIGGSLLTLAAAGDVIFNADVTATGASAGLAIQHGVGKGYSLNGAAITLSGAAATLKIGTEGALQDYALIHSLADMQAINTNRSGRYALGQSLDAAGASVVIGALNQQFSGTFAGLGNTISNLGITGAGLFVDTVANTVIRDIGLVNVSIVTSASYAGGLVGRNYGTVSGSYVTGSVTGTSYVGGLIGQNYGTVSGSYSTASVGGGSNVGGLIGENRGAISHSYATGNVTSSGGSSIGGLVGGMVSSGSVAHSYATGAVTGATYHAGGLVGQSMGSISGSYATGAVVSGTYVGGLVGSNTSSGEVRGSISQSYATGSVSATGGAVGSQAGGLVGSSSGSISGSHATGAVSGQGVSSRVGGLVGWSMGSITQSYATGAVQISGTGTGTVYVGGLVGYLSSNSISYSYAIGAVSGHNTGSGNIIVFGGGLVGYTEGTSANMSQSYATGAVSVIGAGIHRLGGLVGYNAGTLSQSHWDMGTTGRVTAVGLNGATGTLTDVAGFATADAFTAATYGSFDFTNDWFLIAGETRPFLRSEHATTIHSAHQLQLMAMDLGASYKLARDIDLSVTALSNPAGMWRTGTGVAYGFVPVGGPGLGAQFTGSLDGQGHVISNIHINRAGADYAGLFGYAGAASFIHDVSLAGGSVSGKDYVGGLAGQNNGRVERVSAALTVSGTGGSIGGLIGSNIATGHVSLSSFGTGGSGSVSGTWGNVGGLVGTNNGIVELSFASASVSGGENVGGLVGYLESGSITQSHASGSVIGSSYVGGLVGISRSIVELSFASASVSGEAYVGGLVGWNDAGGIVRNAYATGSVIGAGYLGGLVGWNSGTASMVSNSYATGSVNGNIYIGGLVGVNEGAVSLSYATGVVSGTSDVGGLIGLNDGNVSQSYWGNTGQPVGITGIGGGTGTATGVEGLSVSEFQDTAAFMARAAAWDFEGVWAPPSTGYYPVLYALTPVVWVSGHSTSWTYGDSSGTRTITSSGGPSLYGFGAPDDTLILGDGAVPVDPLTNAGSSSGSLTTQNVNVTSTSGVTYRVFTYGDDATVVTPRVITVTALGGTSVYGNSPTNPGLSASNLAAHDTVAALTGLSNSFGIAGTTAAGTHTLTVAGTLTNGNYTILERIDGSWTVTPRSLTITAKDRSKTYGEVLTFGAVLGTDFNVAGLVNDDAVSGLTLASDGAAATAVVADSPYAITASAASGTGLDNYTISYVDGALTVTPRVITVTALGGTSVYGSSPTNPGLSASNLAAHDTVAALTGLSNSFGIAGTTAAGTHTLTVAGTLGNGNYTILERIDGSWTVTPRSLTITAKDRSKTYGEVLTFGAVEGTDFNVAGLVNDDAVSGLTLVSDGAAATAGVATTPYVITASAASGTGLDNYTISYVDGALTVTPRVITVTALGGTSVYGTSPTNPGLSASNLAAHDTVAALTGLSNSFGIAGTTAAGTHTLTVAGTLTNGNYTITERIDGSWAVTPRSLTITAKDRSKTYGEVLTFGAVEDTDFSVAGLVNDDAVSGLTLASDGAAATAVVTTTPYVITASAASGSGLDNYTISYVDGALTVTPRVITVTALGGTSVYGSSPTNPGLSASNLAAHDTVAALTGLSNSFGIAGTTAAGTHTLTVAGTLGNGNYTISERIDGSWTVTPRSLTITAKDRSKTYGEVLTFGAVKDTDFSVAGLVNDDAVTGLTLASDGAAATAGVTTTPYAITASAASGTGLDNYTISYVDGALTVTPRVITVTALGGTSVYGSSPTNPGLSASNLAAHDTVAALTGLSNSFGIAGTTAAGTHTLTVAGTLGNGNYTITERIDGSWTVTPRSLTITAKDRSKTYGEVLTFGAVEGTDFNVAGLVNDDAVSGLTLASDGAAATAGVTTTPYAITASAASGSGLDNYTISYVDGALTVTPRVITVTALGGTSVYGSSPTNPGLSASNLAAHDTVAALTGLSNSFGIAGTTAAGTHTLTVAGTLGNGNYTLSERIDGSWTVTPRSITVTADDQMRWIGEPDPALTWSITGGDLASADEIDTVFSGGLEREPGEGVGDYAILQGTLLANDNYALSFIPGTFTITPMAITGSRFVERNLFLPPLRKSQQDPTPDAPVGDCGSGAECVGSVHPDNRNLGPFVIVAQ